MARRSLKLKLENGDDIALNPPNIILAAEKGIVEDIDRAISLGVSVDFQEANTGITALHVACAKCEARVFDRLLEHGANAHIRDGFGRTAYDISLSVGRHDFAERLYKYMFPENLMLNDPYAEP